MTRNLAGLILVAAAAFFAASAAFLGWRVAGQAAALPGNEDETITLTAAGASYYSMTRLTEITGASLTVTDTVRGIDLGSAYPAIAAWDVERSVDDTTHHQRLEPASRTLVFDRTTAELVNCCDGNIDGNGLIRQTGIAGYAFPVGTRKQTLDVFDTVLDRPEPASYSGTDTVAGIGVYLFTESVPTAKAPSSAAFPSRTTLYSTHRVYGVDPETGLVLTMSEDPDLYVAPAGTGTHVTDLFDASLRMTPASVARLVSQDTRVRARISLIGEARTACLCVAGVLVLAAGWLLVPWSARRRPPSRSPLPDGEPLLPGGS
jgi:Porin PorA